MVRVLSKILGTKSFYVVVVVVVVQRAAKKFTKTYNAREVRNSLFAGVVPAVALVVCLRSLIFYKALFLSFLEACAITCLVQ